jgi:hypothetical protein
MLALSRLLALGSAAGPYIAPPDPDADNDDTEITKNK